jgi:hypothetical protein
MNKLPVRVIIAREVQLISPGMEGRKFDFNPGYSFSTNEWYHPGELFEEGPSAGKPRSQWSFVTNTGTDLPLFFEVEDIKEVTIPVDPETIKVFNGAPFKVIMRDK